MAADWEVPMRLSDRDRRLVLRSLRAVRSHINQDNSSVAEVVDGFIGQVEAGADPVRLRLRKLDRWGLEHLGLVLSALAPLTGVLRCPDCGGLGEVKVPVAVSGLAGDLDRRYQLFEPEGDRQKFRDWPADPDARARLKAADRAEQKRRDDSRKREEAASRIVVTPGQLAAGETDPADTSGTAAASTSFIPPGVRERV